MQNLKKVGQIVFELWPKRWLCLNNLVTYPSNVHVHTKSEEIWLVSFQLAAKRMFLVNKLVTMATSCEFLPNLILPHCAPPQCACPYHKFEEIWSVSFQMAAKRMFLVNNLGTMVTSCEFSPKLILPHWAPPQCACPYQIWRDLVSKFSNGSQKNVFGKQLGYHGNQFWIFT